MQMVASPNCTFWEIETESLEHFFFNCQITKHFWLEVFIRWNFVNELKIQPNVKDIFLGKYGDKYIEKDFVNLIILAGKASIWSYKQNAIELNVLDAKIWFYIWQNSIAVKIIKNTFLDYVIKTNLKCELQLL